MLTPTLKAVKKKFFIYTLGRTGSTLLQSLLSQLPSVDCEGEILANGSNEPTTVAKDRAILSTKDYYGFKVKATQIRDCQADPFEFVENLASEGWKIIHLKRDNILNMAISYIYARECKVFFHYKSRLSWLRKMPVVTIDPYELLSILDCNMTLKDYDDKLMAAYDHLELSYEKDLEKQKSHIDCINKLSKYLGCAHLTRRLKVDLVKSIPDASKVITNWSEVESALKNTCYHHFLP